MRLPPSPSCRSTRSSRITSSRSRVRAWGAAAFAAWVLVSPPAALAQDDPFEDEEDFDFDDLSDGEKKTKEDAPPAETPPAEAPPAEEALPEDEEAFEFEDEVTEEGDRLEEDLFSEEGAGTDAVAQEGQDTVEAYRAEQRSMRGLAADEEIMAWEAYLERYPNALYRERIEERIQTLLDEQYRRAQTGGSLDPEDPSKSVVDLKDQEVPLVSPLRLPNLNPRSRVLVGGMFGYPLHLEAWGDFEYAFLRQLSVHAGVWGRYTGWGLEVGLRGSPVKSAKDKVVLTPALDLRLNFGPLLFSVRPQLGVGAILADRVDLLANFGAEITAQKNASVGLFGGLHLSVRVAQPVAIFLESEVYARRVTRADGAFVFGNVGLGLRFYPKLKSRTDDAIEVLAAGYARSTAKYLEPFQGAAAVQMAYYLKDNTSK